MFGCAGGFNPPGGGPVGGASQPTPPAEYVAPNCEACFDQCIDNFIPCGSDAVGAAVGGPPQLAQLQSCLEEKLEDEIADKILESDDEEEEEGSDDDVDLGELLAAVDRVLAGILTPVLHRVVARPLDVEGATARITALLELSDEISWHQALGPSPSLTDVLSTLLALLELARRGTLTLTQPASFAPLVITRESTRSAA